MRWHCSKWIKMAHKVSSWCWMKTIFKVGAKLLLYFKTNILVLQHAWEKAYAKLASGFRYKTLIFKRNSSCFLYGSNNSKKSLPFFFFKFSTAIAHPSSTCSSSKIWSLTPTYKHGPLASSFLPTFIIFLDYSSQRIYVNHRIYPMHFPFKRCSSKESICTTVPKHYQAKTVLQDMATVCYCSIHLPKQGTGVCRGTIQEVLKSYCQQYLKKKINPPNHHTTPQTHTTTHTHTKKTQRTNKQKKPKPTNLATPDLKM